MTNRAATKDETISHLHDVIFRLQGQNKRYREALQTLSELDRIENCLGEEVIEVARKALEGGTHDNS